MTIFTARFDSPCGACDGLIKKGSEVTWQDDEVVHVECPDEPLGLTAAPVCGVCFQTKAVNGVCGCDE